MQPFEKAQSVAQCVRTATASITCLACLTLLAATPLQASEAWFLLARHGECSKVDILKRKIPELGEVNDPHAFVALMRKSGHKVTFTQTPLSKGRAYEVIVPEKELSLLFVTKELCTASSTR